MKKLFCLMLPFLFCVTGISAQKPIIDTNIFDKWPSVGGGGISNDGKHAFYTIENQPVGHKTLIIKEIHGNWKKEIINGSDVQFTDNSHQIIYKIPNDSLVLMNLTSKKLRYITNVRGYKLFMQGKKEWMAYQLGNASKDLIILNLQTGREKKHANILDYSISPNGKILVLCKQESTNTPDSQVLIWDELLSGNQVEIWKGRSAEQYIFDRNSEQLAFVSQDSSGKSIWYYKSGTQKAGVLVNKEMPGIAPNQEIGTGGNWRFSRDGERLFFSLTQRPQKPNNNAVKVNIWHYQDAKLQSQQLKQLPEYPILYTYIVNIPQKRIFQLTGDNERIAFISENNDKNVLVEHCEGDENEWYWNAYARQSVYLVSTLNGERTPIKLDEAERLSHLQISPTGKYVIYYALKHRNYFSYDIATGVSRNITKNISTNWLIWDADEVVMPNSGYSVGLSGWLENDAAVLINDRYDIWQVDPTSVTPSINLTNGIGNKTQTIFYLAVNKSTTIHSKYKRILLKAFNRENKHNGFYALTIGRGLAKLHMGPYSYGGSYLDYSTIADGIKSSKDDHHFLVLRENASESPNYFYTTDFRTFEPVSNIHPEKHYNWLHTELYTYKLPNGDTCQGVLYKPENYDSTKKYPVVIYFYESNMSDKLHGYQQPAFSVAVINIPYYVSNDYLVYTPDIHYETGRTGESALNAVLAAAGYLATKPWVNTKRIAVHGHSMGGYETNYIVTHSNIFAAAISVAGVSDLVSGFGGIWGSTGMGEAGLVEIGQIRIGCPPWNCPDLYVKNSPVFHANQVATPLLMMHNPNDGAVPFSQSIEFYTALRRCGKRVWLLEYEGEDHVVINKAAQKDYTIRMKQFLDHYLKGESQPVWMTRGVPARLKGIEMGLDLDHSFAPAMRDARDTLVKK